MTSPRFRIKRIHSSKTATGWLAAFVLICAILTACANAERNLAVSVRGQMDVGIGASKGLSNK